MKIKLPTTPEWYAALIFIVGPILAFLSIEPTWSARFIALSFWFIPPPLFAFWVAFDPRITLMLEGAYLYKRYGKKRIDTFNHVLAFTAGVIAVFIFTVPFIKDLIEVLNDKAPLIQSAYVTNTQGVGRGLIWENVTTEQPIDKKNNSYNAIFFSPRHIMHSKTYEFIYLPNTRLILEARLIKEGKIE